MCTQGGQLDDGGTHRPVGLPGSLVASVVVRRLSHQHPVSFAPGLRFSRTSSCDHSPRGPRADILRNPQRGAAVRKLVAMCTAVRGQNQSALWLREANPCVCDSTSASRWHTISPALTLQAFGLLTHNLLGRLVEVASNAHNAVASLRARPGAEPGTMEAFAEHVAQKDLRHATAFGMR